MKRFTTLLIIVLITSTAWSQKIYKVEYESQADLKVYVVEYESQADLKIYKVEYESQAGWRNKDKQHLLL